MKLLIKNMVSLRCKMIVKSELENLGLHPLVVELGEVTIIEDINGEKQTELSKSLRKYGFELLEDKKMHPDRKDQKHHRRNDPLQRRATAAELFKFSERKNGLRL